VAVAAAVVRGQAPGEAGTRIEEAFISISSSRHVPTDLGGGVVENEHSTDVTSPLPIFSSSSVRLYEHSP
jgi:hypothetical protein